MVALELLLIGVILVIQPLILVAWGYVVFRLVARFTLVHTGEWVDNRVQNAAEEIKP